MVSKKRAIILIIAIILTVLISIILIAELLSNPPVDLSFNAKIYDTLEPGYINGTFYSYDMEVGKWKDYDGSTFVLILDSEMPHQYMLDVVFYANDGLLYDCIANVTYLSTNGTLMEESKELRIVDVNVHDLSVAFSLVDYQTEPNINFTLVKPFLRDYEPFVFNENSTLSTIVIKTYGYLKP